MEFIQSEKMKRSEYFNIMIYAKPGAGKTTTVKYLKGKTLMLDCDGTSKVLSGLPNITIATLDPRNPVQDMADFYGYAKAHAEEYDNVVIDNLSHYQKLWLMFNGRNTKSGQPELQHYGIFDTHLIDLISVFNNLPNTNIVYTAWENTRQIQMESGQLYNQFLPDIREKVVNHIMGIVPVVARLIRNPETGQRGFLLTENNGNFAK
ncbi:TPA: AAA family ATPase, partial [Listeria monocytogenes]|nr:DNA-binding protein [Listeria monocytogenes]HAK1069752.1 AAA family ATPase [Listeria monocytogenes]